MRVVLSGGGTAGHINPALALAEVLRNRGCDVRFAGTPTGVEARLVREAGIPFTAFEAAGFNRNHPKTIVRALRLIASSTREAKEWFAEISPDVVVGFGGYVSIPVGRAAVSRSIPLVVHEQNSVMGLANRQLARKAAAVCLTYEQAGAVLADGSRVVMTGNPVRSSVLAATRDGGRRRFGIPEDARMVLVTGGSLGARHLNQRVVALKDDLLSYDDLYIVQVTGPKELDAVTERLALSSEEARRWQVLGYTDHMGEAIAAADAVVSRAGASSLAEISARAIPALLVPFPYATGDHQTTNARACVEAGAAFMVADADLDSPEFERALRLLIEDASMRERMGDAAREQKTVDAADKLADVVIGAAR